MTGTIFQIPLMHRGSLELQRAELMEKIRGNLAEHEANGARSAREGDAEGVRIAEAGAKRCRTALEILLSGGGMMRAA